VAAAAFLEAAAVAASQKGLTLQADPKRNRINRQGFNLGGFSLSGFKISGLSAGLLLSAC